MSAEADFLNAALGLVGQARITSIDDPTPNAHWCKVYWPPLRRALLRTHYWNFSEARATLSVDAATPGFEFAFSYSLPSNFIRLKEYNGDQLDLSAVDPIYWLAMRGRYKIEGNKLLTNDAVVKMVYGSDVTNPALFDPLFYQVAFTWLSGQLAASIGKDAQRAATMISQAVGLLLPFATAVDAQEGSPARYYVDDLIFGR